MASYIINSIKDDYVNLTVKINGVAYDQTVCGMPTDDQNALEDALAAYVTDYANSLNPSPVLPDILTPSNSLIGQEIEVPILIPIKLK